MSLSLSLSATLTAHMRQPAASLPETKFVIAGDEDLAEWDFRSRTAHASWTQRFRCTPSVQRFYPRMVDQLGDFRVNVSPLEDDYLRLNGEDSRDDPKTRYQFNAGTGIFNTSGFPQQAYVTMQLNELRGEFVNSEWFKFDTLFPASNVADVTHATHPHFVHMWDLVCWNSQAQVTIHKPNTPQGIIYYYLVSNEGYGYIPARYVKRVER